jgi:hypothetical protein
MQFYNLPAMRSDNGVINLEYFKLFYQDKLVATIPHYLTYFMNRFGEKSEQNIGSSNELTNGYVNNEGFNIVGVFNNPIKGIGL